MIYNKIEEIRKEKNISKTEFYKAIGMSTTGFLQMVENNSMKITTLEKIAEVLNVPISIFFEEALSGVNPLMDKAEYTSIESREAILKRYSGLDNDEKITLMATEISVLQIRLSMANDIAELRLKKIDKLEKQTKKSIS